MTHLQLLYIRGTSKKVKEPNGSKVLVAGFLRPYVDVFCPIKVWNLHKQIQRCRVCWFWLNNNRSDITDKELCYFQTFLCLHFLFTFLKSLWTVRKTPELLPLSLSRVAEVQTATWRIWRCSGLSQLICWLLLSQKNPEWGSCVKGQQTESYNAAEMCLWVHLDL